MKFLNILCLNGEKILPLEDVYMSNVFLSSVSRKFIVEWNGLHFPWKYQCIDFNSTLIIETRKSYKTVIYHELLNSTVILYLFAVLACNKGNSFSVTFLTAQLNLSLWSPILSSNLSYSARVKKNPNLF